MTVPFIPDNYTSVWAQYSVLAKTPEHRREILARLNKNGIPTAIYYAKPLHLQSAFKNHNNVNGDFPISEEMSQRIFSLPMHPYLRESEIDQLTSLF